MSRAALAAVVAAAEFDALLAGALPLLVTFTGARCIICRQLAPMLAAVVAEAGEALASAKIDVDLHPALAERYAIRSLPTTLLFRDGGLADRISGFATAGRLRDWLRSHGVARVA